MTAHHAIPELNSWSFDHLGNTKGGDKREK